MQVELNDQPVERTELLVWGATLAVGAIAWFGSGTPLAGGAVILAVLLATASPSGALYATCAAIPLIFHPVEIDSLRLGLLEVGILTSGLGTATRFAYDWVTGVRWPLRAMAQPSLPFVLPLAFLLVGLLSLLWMPFDFHRAEALRTWRWVIVEPVAAFILARIAIYRDGRWPLTAAVSLPAMVVAGAAIWQSITASTSFSVDDVHRSTGTYPHPNNLALYLERALFLVLVPGLLTRGRWRTASLTMATLIALGIGVTFSRGAFLALAAGGGVFLLLRPVRRGWSILGVGIGLLAIVFGAIAGRRLTGSDSSGIFATRRYLWEDAAQMIRDFPINGIGLDQFLWLHQQRYIDPRIWSERYVSHPHNLLLDSWISLGLPGVLLLLGFLAAGTWLIWGARTGRRELDPWQVGALASLAAAVGHGIVDNGYFLPDLAVLTWLSIALVISNSPVSRSRIEPAAA